MPYQNKDKLMKQIPDIIKNGINSKESIDEIEKFGRYLARPPREVRGGALSTSQIRIAYGEVSRLKMKYDRTSALMLRPKMAYAASRAGGDTYADLKDVISAGIDQVAASQSNEQEAFKNLATMLEAILAYHKSYGGR